MINLYIVMIIFFLFIECWKLNFIQLFFSHSTMIGQFFTMSDIQWELCFTSSRETKQSFHWISLDFIGFHWIRHFLPSRPVGYKSQKHAGTGSNQKASILAYIVSDRLKFVVLIACAFIVIVFAHDACKHQYPCLIFKNNKNKMTLKAL